MAPASGVIKSSARASPILPSETWIKLGIGPRKSSSVCILTAAFVERKSAHGNSDKHRSIVVLSSGKQCSRVRPMCHRRKLCVLDGSRRGNVRPYAPVSPFVCIGQRRPCNGLTQSHAIQLRWLCAKTCFDIAQALAIRICANVMMRNCSLQRRLRTRNSAP